MASKPTGQAGNQGQDPPKRRSSKSATQSSHNKTAIPGTEAQQLSSNDPARTLNTGLRSLTPIVSSRRPRDTSPPQHTQKSTANDNDNENKLSRYSHPVRQASSPSRIPTAASVTPGIESSQRPSTESTTAAQNIASKRQTSLNEPTRSSSSSTASTHEQLTSGDGAKPRWPIPTRLKSPPPARSRQNSNTSSKRSGNDSDSSDQSQNTVVPVRSNNEQQNASQEQPATSAASAAKTLTSTTSQNVGPAKVSRSFGGAPPTLETVEEGDHSAPSKDTAPIASPDTIGVNITRQPPSPRLASSGTSTKDKDTKDEKDKDKNPEGEKEMLHSKTSEPAIGESERLRPATNKPRVQSAGPTPSTRKQILRSLSPDGRQNTDGPSNRMVAETEIVTSIPQAVAAAAANAGDRANSSKKEDGGTIRAKSTAESAKSKKDRKKVARKPASIISGTGSTKADLFEAKVNSAVDEDSSDSDETFVYESNPPELRTRQPRHHSRTPSVTSIQSLGDRRGGMRGIDGVLNNLAGVRGKRSMKFASNSYASSGVDSDSELNTTKKSQHHNRHHDRHHADHSLNPRASKSNLSDRQQDSPYSQATTRMRNADAKQQQALTARTPSKTRSPHYGSFSGSRSPPKKTEYSSPYQSGGEQAQDESAPLVGSVRTHRNHTRRAHPHLSHHLRPVDVDYDEEGRYRQRERRWPISYCGCISILVIVLLIMCGAGIALGTTNPLSRVKILEIQNLLASDQEIMLDLLVQAVNPNIMSISVSEMDVNIFAKSSHVKDKSHIPFRGYELDYPEPYYPSGTNTPDGIDEGNDPIESDPATMLLGRIFQFDSALTFEASPIYHEASSSSGELRLPKPGNKTETGGSARWEAVLKYDFELIVRGILKYQLPWSSRFLTASVQGRISVHPEDQDGKQKEM